MLNERLPPKRSPFQIRPVFQSLADAHFFVFADEAEAMIAKALEDAGEERGN
jgi:hypothetical protein